MQNFTNYHYVFRHLLLIFNQNKRNLYFICTCNLECGTCRGHVRTVQKVDEKSPAWRWLASLHVENSKSQVPSSADWYMPFHLSLGSLTTQLCHNSLCVVLIRRQNNEFLTWLFRCLYRRVQFSAPELKVMTARVRTPDFLELPESEIST
jgi:hypothetical protein